MVTPILGGVVVPVDGWWSDANELQLQLIRLMSMPILKKDEDPLINSVEQEISITE